LKKILCRLKSPLVWVSIIAQIAIIIGLFNVEISDIVKVIGAAVVEICTLAGVLNNPSDKDCF